MTATDSEIIDRIEALEARVKELEYPPVDDIGKSINNLEDRGEITSLRQLIEKKEKQIKQLQKRLFEEIHTPKKSVETALGNVKIVDIEDLIKKNKVLKDALDKLSHKATKSVDIHILQETQDKLTKENENLKTHIKEQSEKIQELVHHNKELEAINSEQKAAIESLKRRNGDVEMHFEKIVNETIPEYTNSFKAIKEIIARFYI